jgi:hypothetical protein
MRSGKVRNTEVYEKDEFKSLFGISKRKRKKEFEKNTQTLPLPPNRMSILKSCFQNDEISCKKKISNSKWRICAPQL